VHALQIIFDLARSATALVFLAYASWSDYKTREVTNEVWLLFGPVAFALTTAELLLYNGSNLFLYAACFGLTTGFAVMLFYSGGFGGADSKALMCLALALPFYPTGLLTPLTGEISVISRSFFPISVFTDSVLFAAFTAVALLFYNLVQRLTTREDLFQADHKKESIGKKILVMLTGYKTPIEELKAKWHVYPMEDIKRDEQGNSRRRLIVLPREQERTEIVERLDDAIKRQTIGDKVWATPGLPMLIFILAGLVATLFFGDIVWVCIRLVLR
jgi:preflagellin peptidase FlaK